MEAQLDFFSTEELFDLMHVAGSVLAVAYVFLLLLGALTFVQVLTNKNLNSQGKLVWIVLIVFTVFLASLVYAIQRYQGYYKFIPWFIAVLYSVGVVLGLWGYYQIYVDFQDIEF